MDKTSFIFAGFRNTSHSKEWNTWQEQENFSSGLNKTQNGVDWNHFENEDNDSNRIWTDKWHLVQDWKETEFSKTLTTALTTILYWLMCSQEDKAIPCFIWRVIYCCCFKIEGHTCNMCTWSMKWTIKHAAIFECHC